MLAILNSLNAHYIPIFHPILMILVSKFMVQRALSDKVYLSLGLLSPLKEVPSVKRDTNEENCCSFQLNICISTRQSLSLGLPS